jgi:uncharacterized protein YfdQ (DUF2303 family)
MPPTKPTATALEPGALAGCSTASDAAAAIDAMERYHGTELCSISRGDEKSAAVLVVPDGMSLHSIKSYLDENREKPERRKGTATLVDTASFVALINRFKSEHTAVYALPNRSAPSLTAVFDYHPAGGVSSVADWMGHRATYAPDLSDNWKSWVGMNGKLMPQGDFAAFIEDHITDVIVPNLDDPKLKTFADLVQGRFAEPSELIALSRGLQVNVESTVKNAVTLGTGEITVQYEESHRDGTGQPINVPNLFVIAIPVFYAGELYRIAARLRYRVLGGKLQWSYLLVRTDLVFDDAFRGIVEMVRKETQAAVFLGSPER